MHYQKKAFQELIEELAAELVNAPAADIPDTIQNGLERIAETLDLQYAGLNFFSEATNKLNNSFAFLELGTGVDAAPRDDISRHFPWFTRMVAEGRSYVIPTIPDDFPPEAATEREYCLQYGITSTAMISIQIGGSILGSMSLWTNRGPRDWPDEIIRYLRFIGKVFANALFRQQAEYEFRSQLEFEMLLSRLSTLFINLPSVELPQQFDQALRLIVELLGMDRGNLFERRAEDGDIVCTHSWTVAGAVPSGQDIGHRQFPWLAARLEAGETVVIPATRGLPAEASAEQEHCRRFDIKSLVAIPLSLRSIAPLCRPILSKVNCSVGKRGPLPAPMNVSSAGSKFPIGEPFSLMRSAICRWNSRRNSSGSSRMVNSNGSAARARSGLMSGSSPPPPATCGKKSGRSGFVRTFSIASMSFRLPCRRSGNDKRTFRS